MRSKRISSPYYSGVTVKVIVVENASGVVGKPDTVGSIVALMLKNVLSAQLLDCDDVKELIVWVVPPDEISVAPRNTLDSRGPIPKV